MTKVTVVTSNLGKLEEIKAVLSEDFEITHADIDLPEIQSMDVLQVVTAKAVEARKRVEGAVIVEDISAELECMRGLPGPFVKYFLQRMGQDALWTLASPHIGKRKIVIKCGMAYFDSNCFYACVGSITGQVVSPRGDSGFGYDRTIIVDDFPHKTVAELGPTLKNKYSARAIAAKELSDKLREAGVLTPATV